MRLLETKVDEFDIISYYDFLLWVQTVSLDLVERCQHCRCTSLYVVVICTGTIHSKHVACRNQFSFASLSEQLPQRFVFFVPIVHFNMWLAGDFIPLSKNLQSISLVMASCPRKRNYIRGFLKCGYPKNGWFGYHKNSRAQPPMATSSLTWISLQRNQDWILSCQTANMLTHVDKHNSMNVF